MISPQVIAEVHAMTRELLAKSRLDEISELIVRRVEALAGARALLLTLGVNGELEVRAGTRELIGSPHDAAIARWCLERRSTAGFDSATLPACTVLFLPIARSGVVGIALGERRAPMTSIDRRRLAMFIEDAGLALDRALALDWTSEDAEQAKRRMLTSVSHDLRTPLASIRGAAEMLLETRVDSEERRSALEAIRDNADELAHFVGDLLLLGRLESGAARVRKEPVPLEELISSAIERAPSELCVELPEELLLVPVEPALFVRALETMLTRTAARSLRASTRDDALSLEISHDGPSVDLERFYHSDDRRRVFDSGVELAVCDAVMRAHGGSVSASDGRFMITLPLETHAGSELQRTVR